MLITTNGIRLHVEDRGDGPLALVLLHYWGGSSQTWHHVTAALEGEARIVALDQRGWGRSDRPETGYALRDLADDVEGVIGALALERYVLVGHSMGGKVAQVLAARRPPGLAGLVLVAPSPPSPMALSAEIRAGMVRAYDSRESILATVGQVLTGSGLEAGDLALVVADSLAGSRQARAAWPLSASQEDITGLVGEIEVPAIVLSGTQDRVDPPEVLEAELLPRLPQARLHRLTGAGHLLPLEASGEVARLIRSFVTRLPDAGAVAARTDAPPARS